MCIRDRGTALYPDSPYDCHGVYSGSALAESENLHLFFTGHVKIDGDYDYINEGRETSTCLLYTSRCVYETGFGTSMSAHRILGL